MFGRSNQIGGASASASASASAAEGHVSYDGVSQSDSIYASHRSDASELLVARPPNQLTISFRGQVYVFDAVAPDKVDAVLSLLSASTDLSSGMELAQQNQNQNHMAYQNRSSLPQRAQSLDRFRKKRNARCFEKKVRYGVRQEVALRSGDLLASFLLYCLHLLKAIITFLRPRIYLSIFCVLCGILTQCHICQDNIYYLMATPLKYFLDQ